MTMFLTYLSSNFVLQLAHLIFLFKERQCQHQPLRDLKKKIMILFFFGDIIPPVKITLRKEFERDIQYPTNYSPSNISKYNNFYLLPYLLNLKNNYGLSDQLHLVIGIH